MPLRKGGIGSLKWCDVSENSYLFTQRTYKKANYVVKVCGVDITPYPVKRGKESTFSIAATTDDNISGGKLVIDVKYLFLHVHQETHDICKETSCPVSGDFLLSHSQALPGIAPPVNHVDLILS
ncbi:hypothetical protein BC332_32798 [Capsicum chinense]|nr:hypothetical protein BC332_32798 [Capsicum chinense]